MNLIENDKDIKKPAGLIGRERVVFGNVQRIYEFHREYVQINIFYFMSIVFLFFFFFLLSFILLSTFSPQLEQCIENPDTLGRLFTVREQI